MTKRDLEDERPSNADRRWRSSTATKRKLVDARPSNAARCCLKMAKSWKATKRDLVVASTRHHRACLLKYYRDHRARLVSSNRDCFAHYKHISYFFNEYRYSLSLYVSTWGMLGCLLGFCPLGQNLAEAIKPRFQISLA